MPMIAFHLGNPNHNQLTKDIGFEEWTDSEPVTGQAVEKFRRNVEREIGRLYSTVSNSIPEEIVVTGRAPGWALMMVVSEIRRRDPRCQIWRDDGVNEIKL